MHTLISDSLFPSTLEPGYEPEASLWCFDQMLIHICNSYNTGARDVWHLLHWSTRARSGPRAECNKCHASRVRVITILYPMSSMPCRDPFIRHLVLTPLLPQLDEKSHLQCVLMCAYTNITNSLFHVCVCVHAGFLLRGYCHLEWKTTSGKWVCLYTEVSLQRGAGRSATLYHTMHVSDPLPSYVCNHSRQFC